MIYILSKEQAKTITKYLNTKDNAIIRILNPGEEFPNIDTSYFKDILRLNFYDKKKEDKEGFTIHHLEQMVKFFERNKNRENFIVHCHSGISRSSATAIGYCMSKNNYEGIQQIYESDYYMPTKIYFPNNFIVNKFAEYYNFDKEFLNQCILSNLKKIINEAGNYGDDDLMFWIIMSLGIFLNFEKYCTHFKKKLG